MRTQKSKWLVIILCLLLSLDNKAQDIHFSQYDETPTTLNPALLGLSYDNRVMANYRNQWSTVSSRPYQTMGLTYDGGYEKKLRGKRIGYGINLIRDIAGDAKLSSLLPSVGISYSQKISRTMRAAGGFQFGLNYRTIDYSNLRWGSQYQNYKYDNEVPSGEDNPRSSVLSTDVAAGVHLSYAQSEKYISAKDGSKFNIGFSAYHFSIPKSSFLITTERIPNRFVVYMNGEYFIPNTKIALDPSTILMLQGPSKEFIMGMMFKFVLVSQSKFTSLKKPSYFSVGGSYRFKDAIIPAILYSYDRIAFGFSYDINVSQLTPTSRLNGGLEVMLKYSMSAGYGKNLGRSDTKASY